jgi:hypothetical protein
VEHVAREGSNVDEIVAVPRQNAIRGQIGYDFHLLLVPREILDFAILAGAGVFDEAQAGEE